jgi:methylenetetrahydrofolate reductase (NADPH)
LSLDIIPCHDDPLQAFGIEHGAEMCRKLLDGGVPGLHMYSLNLEATVLGILERVGFIEINRVSRSLPWKHIPMGTRRQVSASRGVVVCVCVSLGVWREMFVRYRCKHT